MLNDKENRSAMITVAILFAIVFALLLGNIALERSYEKPIGTISIVNAIKTEASSKSSGNYYFLVDADQNVWAVDADHDADAANIYMMCQNGAVGEDNPYSLAINSYYKMVSGTFKDALLSTSATAKMNN